MSRKTRWGTASGRTDVRDLGDDFFTAEMDRLERMKPVPQAERGNHAPPLISWNDTLQRAVRRDGLLGAYIVDRTMEEGQR